MCRQAKDVKTYDEPKAVHYGNSSVALSARCTGQGGAMRYPNLEDCSKQK